MVLGSGFHWPLPSLRDDQCVPYEQGWWVSWLVWGIREMYEHSPPSGKIWFRGMGWRLGRGGVRGDCLTGGLLPSRAPVLAMDWVSGGKGHCALVSPSGPGRTAPHSLCLLPRAGLSLCVLPPWSPEGLRCLEERRACWAQQRGAGTTEPGRRGGGCIVRTCS